MQSAPPQADAPQPTVDRQTLIHDVQWLRNLSSDHFVIAHASFRLYERALVFQKGHEELARAKIVPILLDGEIAYTVITGPFKSQDRASTSLQRLSWAADCKVLTVTNARRLADTAFHRIH